MSRSNVVPIPAHVAKVVPGPSPKRGVELEAAMRAGNDNCGSEKWGESIHARGEGTVHKYVTRTKVGSWSAAYYRYYVLLIYSSRGKL